MNYHNPENLFLTWNTVRAVLHNGWWLVVSFYLVADAHLDASQLLLIAVAQGVVSLVFEAPAGILADVVSRKWSIVVSHALMGAAMVSTGLVTGFLPLVATQMLWGISWTFTSGADVAWVTDELNEPDRIHLVLARTARRQFLGAGIGIVLFAVLAAVAGRHQAIVLAGIAMLVLGLLVAVTFPERGFTPTRTYRFRAAVSITRDGARIVVRDQVIFLLVLTTFVVNGAADVFTRAYPARLDGLGFPTNNIGTVWFGALGIVGFIAGGLALLGVERRIAHQSAAKVSMLFACGFGVVGLGILALAPSISLAVIGVLLASGVAMPISRTVTTIWVNQKCESRVRATMHSFFSQSEYLGEILCGLATAWVARSQGTSWAMGSSCVLFITALIIVALIRTGKRSTDHSISPKTQL